MTKKQTIAWFKKFKGIEKQYWDAAKLLKDNEMLSAFELRVLQGGRCILSDTLINSKLSELKAKLSYTEPKPVLEDKSEENKSEKSD